MQQVHIANHSTNWAPECNMKMTQGVPIAAGTAHNKVLHHQTHTAAHWDHYLGNHKHQQPLRLAARLTRGDQSLNKCALALGGSPLFC